MYDSRTTLRPKTSILSVQLVAHLIRQDGDYCMPRAVAAILRARLLPPPFALAFSVLMATYVIQENSVRSRQRISKWMSNHENQQEIGQYCSPQEAKNAEQGSIDPLWRSRFESFSKICDEATRTHIAFLGTAL